MVWVIGKVPVVASSEGHFIPPGWVEAAVYVYIATIQAGTSYKTVTKYNPVASISFAALKDRNFIQLEPKNISFTSSSLKISITTAQSQLQPHSKCPLHLLSMERYKALWMCLGIWTDLLAFGCCDRGIAEIGYYLSQIGNH